MTGRPAKEVVSLLAACDPPLAIGLRLRDEALTVPTIAGVAAAGPGGDPWRHVAVQSARASQPPDEQELWR